MRQGDTYEELGVQVDDQNDDESERKIKMVYSQPPGKSGRQIGKQKQTESSVECGYGVLPISGAAKRLARLRLVRPALTTLYTP